jgi:hypothetical protein
MNLHGGNLTIQSPFNLNGGLNTGIDPTDLVAAASLTVYPNPSSGRINFTFSISESSRVTLDILSMNGSLITRVFEGQVDKSVEKTINYDSQLPQGVYFYQLKTAQGVKYGKIVIARTF